MKTPIEKANELISIFLINQNKWYLENLVDGLRIAQAKKCALISVDEILKVAFYSKDEIYKYYIEVKQELKKL